MLGLLLPGHYVDNVLELQPAQLQSLGIRGLLLDVDCTLKDYYATTFSVAIHDWVDQMQSRGMKLCLLSNGGSRRIGELAAILGVPFIARAFKPFPFGCRRGLRLLGLNRHETAVVGDQLFADVMAGKLAGLHTILVRPTHPAEPWFTQLKRPLERCVLRGIAPPATVVNSR